MISRLPSSMGKNAKKSHEGGLSEQEHMVLVVSYESLITSSRLVLLCKLLLQIHDLQRSGAIISRSYVPEQMVVMESLLLCMMLCKSTRASCSHFAASARLPQGL
jgi:hypothetical protein